jgi:RHS repeat-associated protein
MTPTTNLLFTTSPQTRPARKPRCFANLTYRRRSLYGRTRRHFTGKGQDAETGLYYYGARYLDPRAARWAGGDPALGEYIPAAWRGSGGLPGMGGVYNTVNLHVYHYAGNNPVKYVDPDGREDDESELTKNEINILLWRSRDFNSMDEAAKHFAMQYNDDSFIMNREISASISKTEEGKFYYTVPRIGEKDSSISYYSKNIVANIHTHGGLATGLQYLPSSKDISNVVKYQTAVYIVNPLGDIMRLDPQGNKSNNVAFTHIGSIGQSSPKRSGNFMVTQVEYDRISNKLLSIRGMR